MTTRTPSPLLPTCSAFVLLACATTAQQTFVSPITAATVDGASQNAAPWGTPTARRYLQIHSDVPGPKVFKQIAFRKSIQYANGGGTLTVDFELLMNKSVDWDKASFLISNNYIGTPTKVMARKTLVFGPLVGTTNPAPFEVKMPLDTPYVYIGTTSFAWEALVYSSAMNGTFPGYLDADDSSQTNANSTVTGTGCVAGGRTTPMIHTLAIADIAGLFTIGGYVDAGPANAPTVLYVGSSNPASVVPGLCGPLYTNLLVAVPLGLTDATGFIGEKQSGTSKIAGAAFSLLTPNTFPGVAIYTQVHSLDGSQPTIPIANSDGRTFVVPTSNKTKTAQVTRVYDNDAGPTGNAGQFFAGTSVGYGLVVEFTY